MTDKKHQFPEIDTVFISNKKEVVVEQTPNTPYNSSSVKLQSLRDAHIQYDGQVTGKHYEWMKAGDVQPVETVDAPYLLAKQIKTQSCCGENEARLFQQVD